MLLPCVPGWQGTKSGDSQRVSGPVGVAVTVAVRA
jgi:hypothetical protein